MGVPPNVTEAIFSDPPTLTQHYQGNGWVLETPNASTLQIRTASGGFYDYGFIHPENCVPNSGTMATKYRYSVNAGEVLQAPLCNEGSYTLVNIWRFGEKLVTQFRCHRATGNHNVCQRLY